MKKWFANIEKKKQLYLVIGSYVLAFILCIIFVFCPEDSGIDTVMFILFSAALALAIIFNVFYVKNKNQSTDVAQTEETSIKEEKQIEVKVNCVKLVTIDDIDYGLKYVYKENLCFCENFDSFELMNDVTFKLEEDNEFDPNTVAAYVKDKKIGLMFKGDAREIVISSIKTNKYKMMVATYLKDVENKKIGILIGFYAPLDEKNSIVASITKTSKKDELTNEKRYEQLELLSEGDTLTLEESFECDGLLVLNKYGYEVGELSESISEKINENCDSLEDIFVKVEEVSVNDNLKTKVKVRIYY